MNGYVNIGSLDSAQKSILISDYLSGLSIKTIALKRGISHNGVWSFLRRNNIKIRPDNFKSNRKYNFDIHVFDKIDTEAKAYWLGFLYADGCNFEPRYTVSLNLVEGDKPHIEAFAHFLDLDRPLLRIRRRTPNSQHQYSISASDMHFSAQLARLGMVRNKTFTLCFPTEDQVPTNLVRHFLRGYFDGDGSIAKAKHRRGKPTHRPSYFASFVSTEKFCECVSAILMKELGVKVYMSTRFPERKNSTRQISFNGNLQVARFLDWLYKDATVFLSRKHDRYLELKRLNLIRSKRVRKFSKEGTFIEEFSSIDEAATSISGDRRGIMAVCNGASRYKNGKPTHKRTSYMGFGWKYVDTVWQ